MIPYKVANTGQFEQELGRFAERLDTGALFALGVSHTFERETLPGMMREEYRIMEAEEAAGTYVPAFAVDPFTVLPGEAMLPADNPHVLTEEEFKASPHYRKKADGSAAIPYSPFMTPQRAEIYAEIYDRRLHEKQLMEQSADTLGRKAMLFGASFLASIPDPINFVPVAGVAGKGLSVSRTALRGAGAGAAGTALADALIFPTANARGEDFTFFDAAMDITFGALIGGGLGGAAGKLGEWQQSRASAEFAAEIDRAGQDLAYALEDAGLGVDEANAAAKVIGDSLKKMPDGLERARELRAEIGGKERMDSGLLLDRAAKALADDELMDVGKWRKELGLGETSLPMVRTAELIESGQRPNWRDLSLEEMLPLAKEFYNTSLAGKNVETRHGPVSFRSTSHGWKKIRGGTPERDKLKLLPYIDRILAEADWVDVQPARRKEQAAQGAKMHFLRAVVEFEGKNLEVRMNVREDVNGKLFYDFFNESEPPTWRQKETPPEPRDPSAGESATGGEASGRGAYHAVKAQQTPGQSSGSPDSTLKISPSDGDVNLGIKDITPDFRTAEPLPEYRAPEPPVGPDAELRALGIDPKTGKSLDEAEALRLIDEGKVQDAELLADLEAAIMNAERVQARQDVALEVLGCVIGSV